MGKEINKSSLPFQSKLQIVCSFVEEKFFTKKYSRPLSGNNLSGRRIIMENIIALFRGLAAKEMSEEKVSELRSLFIELLSHFNGRITHWEIELSAADNFLSSMRKAFKELLEKNIFADIETLQIAAQVVTDIYVSRERYDSAAAGFMASLGFFERAWELYEKAICYYPHDLCESGKADLRKKQRLLASDYRLSGKILPGLEEKIDREAKQIVDYAKHAAIWELFHPQKYIPWDQWYAQGQVALPWDHSIDMAHEQLNKMGYDESEQQELFKPAYEDIIRVLHKDSDNNAKAGDTWWIKQIAKYTALL